MQPTYAICEPHNCRVHISNKPPPQKKKYRTKTSYATVSCKYIAVGVTAVKNHAVSEAPPATISGHCATRNMAAVSMFSACALYKSFPKCWALHKNTHRHYENNFNCHIELCNCCKPEQQAHCVRFAVGRGCQMPKIIRINDVFVIVHSAHLLNCVRMAL